MASTAPTPGPEVMDSEKLTPLYHVILLDDDVHTYAYVIEMLHRLFVLSEAQAFHRAVEVDTTGRTVVITCELPQAEFARDQIRGYGPDPRIPESRGSMQAVVEPAGGGE
ncbi:MAG: ATP-dependent Clp protease adaptor ClpS [Bryobacteraceae bacterium]|jgi:ATP-dependent Clp protease adaptor protein ClpS